MKTILTILLLAISTSASAWWGDSRNIDPNDNWNVYSENDPESWKDEWNVSWTWDDVED